jgi:hypothetical protein
LEFIFGLLKQLIENTSASELLIIVALVGSAVFFVIKNFLKYTSGLNRLANVFNGNSADDIKLVIEQLVASEQKIISILEVMQEGAKIQNGNLSRYSTEINALKAEVENEFLNAAAHIENIKQELKLFDVHNDAILRQIDTQLADIAKQASTHEAHNETAYASVRENILRGQEVMHRVLSQVEKVDEFARTAIPEFRSYHKELSKEVSQLSREVGIMDRVLQAHINTNSDGITLR